MDFLLNFCSTNEEESLSGIYMAEVDPALILENRISQIMTR